MRERRRVWNQVLGPRALAVISCALALLAAQPAVGGTSAGQRSGGTVSSVKMSADVGAQTSIVRVRTGNKTENDKGGKGGEVSRVRARDWHVLATVEILQRLLAFELRPMERGVVAALALDVMPVTVVVLPPYRIDAVDAGRIFLSCEQRFAIEQCLLAPPVA